MDERAKRRVTPILLTVLLALTVAVAGVGIVSVDYAQAATRVSASVGAGGDEGMDEDVEQSLVNADGMTYWNFAYNGNTIFQPTATGKVRTGNSNDSAGHTGSIRSFTVPETGWYSLEAWGAQGGDPSFLQGGRGAYVISYVQLTKGQVLQILVGGKGGDGDLNRKTWNAGGGGGGTFIALGSSYSNASPLAVAGGGGGGNQYPNSSSNVSTSSDTWYKPVGTTFKWMHGQNTQAAGNNGSYTKATVGYGGINGCTYSAGGGGFYGNSTGSSTTGSYGIGFRQGGTGGTKTSNCALGGYGGGGSTHGSSGGGAGGGGYTGGHGNQDRADVQGGSGGGSYWTGSFNGKASYAKGGWEYFASPTGSQEQGHSGCGYARITQLNTPPTQSGVTPAIKVGRTNTVKVSVTNSNIDNSNYNLNGTDVDYETGSTTVKETVHLANTQVYLSASTSSPATEWLTMSGAAVNGKTFVLKANKYWSGKKTFYVQVKDRKTNGTVDVGATAWFAFTATCDVATLTPDNKPANTQLVQGMNYRFGTGNTTNPKEAENSNKIYNPLGGNRQTLWLKDPLSTANAVCFDIATLYKLVVPSNNISTTAEDAISYVGSTSFSATRYDKDSGAAQAISSNVAGASDSAYFSSATYDGNVTYSGITGKQTLTLQGKPVPAGPYYYMMTLRIQRVCKSGGGVIDSQEFDIVYRVDNTRPKLTATKAFSVRAGETMHIDLADFCLDEDRNDLTIKNVVVPEGEFVAVDQYGNILTATTGTYPAYGNFNYNLNGTGVLTDDMLGGGSGSAKTVIETTAQHPTVKTGFATSSIYYMDNMPNGITKADAGITQAQGNAMNAYIGYYLNTAATGAAARTQLWITGNKASRSQYAANRVTSSNAAALGHFYILVNIADAGDKDDLGVWLPVCITVESAAPTLNVTTDASNASVYPSVDGERGDSVIFTPVGGYASAETNATLNPIGSTTVLGANNTFNSALKLLAYDRDIYSTTSGVNARTVSVDLPAIGKTDVTIKTPASTLGAMSAQRDIVFLRPADSTGNTGSTINYNLTSALTGNAWDSRGIDDGFKEFFTVEFVKLYAQTSILYALPDSTIQSLVADGVITFEQPDGSDWVVQYWGMQVTLKKHTMGKFINCNVEVVDTFGVTSTLRMPVRVSDTVFGTTSARVTEDTPDRMKFNTRPNANYPNGSASKGGDLVYNFRIKINEANKHTEDLYISPYDLFYDPDTYTVNNGENGTFNTVPLTEGYAEMLAGTQKKIAVNVSDSASSDITTVTDFATERLVVNENSKTPTVSGGGVYATVRYHEETQSFQVVPIGKTPKSFPVSFTMVVYSTATQRTINATINVFVENSLPNKRIEDDKVFYLSATPTLGNSSVTEGTQEGDRGTALNGNRYYAINNNTYNVREFALDDLFLDRDGDSIRYGVGSVIEVGTKDINGNFISFVDKNGVDHNTFLRAYIGAGSNSRSGTNNCLILEGLSSTQGVPGGVWIRFDVTDNALDTTASDKVSYMFQVEVINSVADYADMTGNNAMDKVEQGEGYHWVTESEITSVVGATAFAETADKKIHAPTGEVVTTVNKALYIVSDDSVMEMYKKYVTDKGVPFSYSAQQVRRIAADADNSQGLSLFGGSFTGQSTDVEPDVKFVSTVSQDFSPTKTTEQGKFNSQNPAVIVNTFYANKGENDLYYKENAIVKLVFFADDGVTRLEGNAANTATHWVIAFNFTDTPATDVDVRIRMRDANNEVTYVGTAGSGDAADVNVSYTTGGYSILPAPESGQSAYHGVREISSDKTRYVPNTNISALRGATEDYDGDGVFAVKISKQAQNLYNNFTKWGTTATKEYNGKSYSLNNVWAYDKGADGWYTYEDIETGYLQTTETFFTYDKINVTRTGSVAVPLSYFAWPSEVTANNHRLEGQGQFAWFDVDKFPLTLRSGDIPMADPSMVGSTSNLDNIADAITLSDGVTTWTGKSLNTNPYITFQGIGEVNDPTVVFAGSTYLHNQRRFSITEAKPYATENISPQGSGAYADKYFFEDTFGLQMTKKNIRSVGELTLTVRLAVWKGANAISSTATALPTKEKDADGNTMTITVNVPVSVENTFIDMQDTSVNVELTAANRSGKQIALSTSATGNNEDNTKYLIGNNPKNGSPLDQVVGVDGKRPYAEDIYYAMSSLTTITEPQLNYIKANRAAWSYLTNSADGKNRLLDYFGLAQNSEIDALSIENGKLMYNGTQEVVANPHYTNYFTVSPTGVDGAKITITPIRMTTFDHANVVPNGGETKAAAIEREAKARGLAVKWSNRDSALVDYIYYPLKLIVYDRLTVGLETNSTSFTDASIDVVTINVHIGNSKPTALTRNLSANGVTMNGTKYAGKVLSLSKGASATYAFTDMIEDLDMVADPQTRSYRIEDYFKGATATQLEKDTGDYLYKWSGEGDARQFVKIEVLDATGKNVLADPTQLTCAQSSASSALTVTITLNDISGLTIGSTIGYVRLTFRDHYHTDSVSSQEQIVFEVSMSNAAPTYTQNAQDVRRVTMHSDDYFTLYATPYSNFAQGAGTATVGKLDANKKPAGTPLGNFVGPEAYEGNNKTWRGSRALSGNIRPWSYYDGVYLGNDDSGKAVYSGALDENWKIQGVQEDGTTVEYPVPDAPSNVTKPWSRGAGNNLGYMPIATDDAPWTLRISNVTLTGTGSGMLECVQLNNTLYEGADANQVAPLAVMVIAHGACEDVTLTVTLTDGISGTGSNAPYTLTYTMSLTVVSTPPEQKTKDLTNGLKWNVEGHSGYYSLDMHKGETVELPLKAFATDADSGDEDNLYIFPQEGIDNLFQVSNFDDYNNSNAFAFGTKYTSVTPIRDRNTQRAKSFTVTANNFHSMQDSQAYDQYTFMISDPYYSDKNKTVTIVLRVYVVPASVTAVVQSPIPLVKLNGVQDSTSEKGPSTITIVSRPDEGGLFEDGDVGAQFTAYTVRVYTYATKDGKLTTAQLPDNKDAQLVAEFVPTIDPVNGVTSTTELWKGENAKVLQTYIANIAFSSDGSQMTVYPKRSTYGHKSIPDSSEEGIGLYIEVKKNVGQRQNIQNIEASARLNASINNSAPKTVGETPANYGKQRRDGELLNNGKEFLHLEGVRGDSWTYYYTNPYSEDDEALFVDPDGQAVVAGQSAKLINMFVYDEDDDGGRTPNYMNIGDEGQNKASYPDVWASAEKAFAMTRDLKVNYSWVTGSGETTEVHKEQLNGMAISVANKIDLSSDNRLTQYKGRTVYLTIRVYGKDEEGKEQSTDIVLGIANSTPSFKPQTGEDAINGKYNDPTKYTSYEGGGAEADAFLTLTLNQDADSRFLGNKGVLSVPLSDLVNDADFAQGTNSESFTLVHAAGNDGASTSYDDFAMLSNHPEMTLYATKSGFSTTNDGKMPSGTLFSVRVSDVYNTALIFQVHSYERGASKQLRLVVADSSGAKTRTLTVTLAVGNSAPVDLTSGDPELAQIVLAGGQKPPQGNTFPSVKYSILDFVSDVNEGKTGIPETGADPAWYLRISTYRWESASWVGNPEVGDDPSSGGSSSGGSSSGGSSSGGGEVDIDSLMLVNFMQDDEQHFSISPIAGRYGSQEFHITISDGGNKDSSDDRSITIILTVQITKNPNDVDLVAFNVYWKQEKPVTIDDIYANNEGDGFIIAGLTIPDNKKSIAEVRHAEGSSVWSIYGNTRNQELDATVLIAVGSSYDPANPPKETYQRPIKIIVGDNLKPKFNLNHNGKEYSNKEVTYITKGMYDDDGMWELDINGLLIDAEGDVLQLESASSDKKALITVSADTQNNKLVFHFKSRGTATIKVKVSDAVGPYTYTFKIGTNDRPEPNFFVGIIARVQSNPLIFLVIGAAFLLLLIILIIIIAAVRKKKKMRAEIEALLVSEMELEEQMLKLAAGPSPTSYQAYGYLPPNPAAGQTNPNMMLGSGQSAPDQNAAIGLNPGAGNTPGAVPNTGSGNTAPQPPRDNFNDDDL